MLSHKGLAFNRARDIFHLTILSGPHILLGKPCIKATHISVALILGYLAAGRHTAAIQGEFSDLTAADVAACLDYARELAEFEAAPA